MCRYFLTLFFWLVKYWVGICPPPSAPPPVPTAMNCFKFTKRKNRAWELSNNSLVNDRTDIFNFEENNSLKPHLENSILHFKTTVFCPALLNIVCGYVYNARKSDM